MPSSAGAGRTPQGPQKLFPPWACKDREGIRGSCFFCSPSSVYICMESCGCSSEGCHSAVGEEPQKADREQGFGDLYLIGGGEGVSMDQIESQGSE